MSKGIAGVMGGAAGAVAAALLLTHGAAAASGYPNVVAKNGFRDGPVQIQTSQSSLGSMHLARGAYVLSAKLQVGGSVTTDTRMTVTCLLRAEGNEDRDDVILQSGGASTSLTLMTAHQFVDPGDVDISCARTNNGGATADHLRITAVKVGKLSIVPLAPSPAP